jgi:hypothetical protein
LSTHNPARDRPGSGTAGTSNRVTAEPARRRRATETKSAFKTTEMMAYVAAVVGVLIAGMILDQNDAGGLGGRQVWLYVSVLTVGYMISRGLAKSGSRDPYWDDDDSGSRRDG